MSDLRRAVNRLPSSFGGWRLLYQLLVVVLNNYTFLTSHPAAFLQVIWNSSVPKPRDVRREAQSQGSLNDWHELWELAQRWRLVNAERSSSLKWLRSLQPLVEKPQSRLRDGFVYPGLEISSICCSTDGRRIAAGGNESGVAWDRATGVELSKFRGTPVGFLSRQDCIVAISKEGIQLIDAMTGNCEVTLVPAHSLERPLAFSPVGDLLAVGCSSHHVHVWSVSKGHELCCIPRTAALGHSVSLSSDAKLLAMITDENKIEVWDIHLHTQVSCYCDQSWSPSAIAFHPDNKTTSSAWHKLVPYFYSERGIMGTKTSHGTRTASRLKSLDVYTAKQLGSVGIEGDIRCTSV